MAASGQRSQPGMVRRMNRQGVAIAALMSLTVLLAMAGPAAAFDVISSSGHTGDYGYLPSDDSSHPPGKCGYGAVQADGLAHLRWIKVIGPKIAARDVTGGRDHQQASWQLKIQRSVHGGPWKTVAHSGIQTKTTYDDVSADYTPMKVSVNGKIDQIYRAIVILRWMRNGNVEGTVKLHPTNYGVKWTVGSPNYVFTDACGAVAD